MSSPFATDKMFRHLGRMAEWQAGGLPPPVTVELDLTNRCNHHCPNCTFRYLIDRNHDTIPLSDAIDYVDQLAAFGVRAVTFSGGGEPLMYGEDTILYLMERCRLLGMQCALITNGSLLRSTRYVELCEWVRVSLDGYDDETYRRFRGADQLELVSENTERLCAAPGQATVGVGFLTDWSSDTDFVLRAAEYCQRFKGLDYIQFRPLVLSWHDDDTLRGGYGERDRFDWIESAAQQAQRLAPDGCRVLLSREKYVSLAEPNCGRTYNRCHAHFLQACISADQRVYLCCHGQGRHSYCLGDLREQSFAGIWHGERAAQVRNSIDPRTMCPPVCRLHPQNQLLQQFMGHTTHENFI